MRVFMFFLLGLVLFLPADSFGQEKELTRKERQLVRSISEQIDRAAKFYVGKKYDDASQAYLEAKSQLETVNDESSPALLGELLPLHAKLVKAQELLAQNGQTVEAPKPLPKNKESPASFVNEVAPILVAKCGGCHVNNSRGQFGMPSYTALMRSGHVVAGDPVESRLIQVIDSGDMPKGGGKVETAELDLLRKWVKDGAKCDGDEAANLRTLGPAAAEPPENASPKLTKATGKESVSFTRDVAPILLDQCTGCHIDAMRPRANLNLANFDALLRGGDNGPILKPGSSADSLLIKKLLGTADGNRMPQGKPALSKASIDLIGKWIDEGATYDAAESGIPIRTIYDRIRAAAMSHGELAKERLAAAKKTWNTFNMGHEHQTVSTNEVQLMMRGRPEAVQGYAEQIDGIVTEIKKHAKLESNQPLIRGKITVMIVDERYDFNEYGNMILGHELPTTLKSFWQFTQVDAHAIQLLAANDDGSTFDVDLCRNLAAVYYASLADDVPRWFADGMGHAAAAKIYSRSDFAAAWEAQAMEVVRRMASSDDFVAGNLPEDQAGLAGYYFISQLRASGPRFGKLMTLLANGDSSFAECFQAAFGQSANEFLKGGNGKNPNSKR